MAEQSVDNTTRLWQVITAVLRATVVMQCLGNWRWFTQIEETPLLHWMLDPTDIGGLAWAEQTAMLVQQWVGWFLLMAGIITAWRATALVVLPVALVQLLITVAMWRIGEGYSLNVTWLPVQTLTLFPFASQLLRIAAPTALMMLAANRQLRGSELSVSSRVMQCLRWATAIVFVAHGIEALQQSPKFVDLLIASFARLLSADLSEDFAQQALAAIGFIDIAVAVALVCTRSRLVVLWIACWGLLTASSRIVAFGWEVAWHEALTRAAHFGVPLAIALWWHLLESGESEQTSK